ncbi:MAG TPA: ATP-binding cassette domain-containing protein [Chthonomonadaceae bacterium]|nr:ATP-binding cassette domain-containing protein [Chthonomonadaceae bacterium]
MAEAALVSAPTQAPIVRVTGFVKRYGATVAVAQCDLDLRAGEIYGLLGPDGAGKSSLMKAIAGVLTFDAGSVEVFGVQVHSERSAERIKGRLGFMPQGLGLNLSPDLSIEENIDFFAQARLVPKAALAERKARLLRMTRLEAFRDRPMRNLSGGMKQKLGLVCTLIHEPELILLDEPTTGVDPVTRRDFWTILGELIRDRGITALVSISYMDEATRFNRASLLFEGRVVAQGTPEALQACVPGTLVALKTERQIEAIARLRAEYAQVEARGPWVRVFAEEQEPMQALAAAERLLPGFALTEQRTLPPELDDVFVALLRRQGLIREQRPSPSTPRTAPAQSLPLASEALVAPAGAAFSAPGESVVLPQIAIEARDLVRDFGKFRAVDRVSFQVRQGEIFGLLGANGAGKTTVIKMLTGIIPLTSGEGRVAGADMRRAGREIKARIGYMSQAFSLYRDLQVIENIRLYAGIYGLSPSQSRQRVAWIIEMAGLAGHEKDRAESLPMGVRQRLALGCALVHKPRILFLDEPTSGVDPVGRRQFWDILFRLSREDEVAILVTTHHMSEAERCDHLVLMFDGRVIADASPQRLEQEVEAKAGRLLDLSMDQPGAALTLLQQNGFPEAALFGSHLHVLSRDPEADALRIRTLLKASDITLLAASPIPLTMEDVFVYRVTALERTTQSIYTGAAR